MNAIDGCDLCGGAHTNEQHVAHERRTFPCRESSCQKPIIMLTNPKTGSSVPVDAETAGTGDEFFDGSRHTSHYKTCKAPNRFSKGGKK